MADEHGFWKLIYLLRVKMGISKKEIMRMSLAEADTLIQTSLWETSYANAAAEDKLEGQRLAQQSSMRQVIL